MEKTAGHATLDEAARSTLAGRPILSIAAATVYYVVKLAAHGVEGVANGDIDIFVSVVLTGVAICDDLTFWNCKLDADCKQTAFTVLMVGRFDDDAAVGDAPEEVLQLRRALAYFAFDCFGARQSPESNL